MRDGAHRKQNQKFESAVKDWVTPHFPEEVSSSDWKWIHEYWYRCEALATPGGKKYQLQPTTSRICGKMIENVLASSFIYLQIFRLYAWNIYILIKTSVYRCSSSNRKHPLISLVMFIVFVFPLMLINWTSFDHKMAQKPQPQVL